MNFRLDVPENETDVASLPENVDAEPSELLVVQREVHLHLFFELAALLAPHEGERQRFQLLIGERGRVSGLRRPMDAVGRRRIYRQIHVRGFLVDHDFEQCANIHPGSRVADFFGYAAPLNAEAPNKFGVMLRDWASPLATTPFVANSTRAMSIVCMPSF